MLCGWGVELDIRPGPGRYMLRVAHDAGDAGYPVEHALEVLVEGTGPILWNVKAAGCANGLARLWMHHPEIAARSWVFDHELCDPTLPTQCPQAAYLWRPGGRPGFAPRPDTRDGWWCDDVDVTAQLMPEDGRFRCYVSPELHQRPVDLRWWQRWAGHGICTDLPHLLEGLQAASMPLQPVDPWWAA